ncbi:MAG: ISL3 family transposase [Actinobacteria bacterium]|nr:ISL3 family transposase [Actinomycetota bacterium]
MDNRELFQAALGLAEPWFVDRITFDADERQLDIFLDFPRGARFGCPEGDAAACSVHDTEDKTWRHLDFFQHKAFLHARVPRVRCETHGVRQVEIPWARPGSGFTLLFEALSMAMLSEMPVKACARIIGEHDTRLWRVLKHYVGVARAKRSDKKVRMIGIDETSSRRGHNYISNFVDLEVPRVLFATEGRDSSTVSTFAADLLAHGGDPAAITDVCMDMSPAYYVGVTTHLPDAQITYDRYHLIQLLTAAVDRVRRDEAQERPELRRTRYAWLKRPENLTRRQRGQIEWLTARHLAMRTARAYAWRLSFDDFFEQPAELAEDYLDRWCRGAMRSRLAPIQAFAQTIRTNWDGVLRWHQTQISNGVLEAINSLVQAAKRRARGYRTTENLIAMTYLIAGKLEMGLPT